MHFAVLVIIYFSICCGNLTSGKKTKITLNDLMYPEVLLEDSGATWINDDAVVYKNVFNEIWMIDTSTDEFNKTLLISNSTISLSTSTDWIVSPSANYVALTVEKHGVTRYQEMRKISMLNVKTKSALPLKLCDKNNNWIVNFQWIPVKREDAFSYVCNKDIYFHSITRNVTIRITNTGSANISNGIPDYMNEEEIFESENTIWWSLGGDHFVFLSFNVSMVDKLSVPSYGSSTEQETGGAIFIQTAYPQVNRPIPVVSLYVWDVVNNKIISFKPPNVVQRLKEFYVYHVNWLTEDQFLVVWSNRVQNVTYHSICSLSGQKCYLFYKQNYTNLWLNTDNPKINYATNESYFATLPKKESDGYWYNHVARFDYAHGKREPVFLTSGAWEVLMIAGLDEENGMLYFIKTEPIFRDERLNSIIINKTMNQAPFCVSCENNLKTCDSITTMFSTKGKYHIFTCNGPDVPKKHLLSSLSPNISITLEANEGYAENFQLPKIKYLTIPLSNGYDALAKLILPADFNESDKSAKLPLIVKVYAGPDSQMVTKIFSIDYDTHLVTDKGFAVALIDGRGTINRGSRYTEQMYRRLGTVEVDDQILATKFLLDSTQWFDRESVMIWGWSYGGFVTTHVVKKDAFETFKCVVAVAPVTDFRLYDAAYTERYMGLDDGRDNALGYKNASVLDNVEAFRKGDFLLIQGLADDNVHFQHSALLMDKLQNENIQFHFMMYPNQKHSISERWQHLHELLDNFFEGCVNSEKD